MDNKAAIAALIVAAGTGERFGDAVPKQYQPLLGRPVLRWSIDALRQHPGIGAVHVVINPAHADFYRQAVEGLDLPPLVLGGASRQESVRLGLAAIAQGAKPGYVLIHDAARPGLSRELISRLCAAVQSADAVIPGLAIADTVKRVTGGAVKTESREGLYAVQTPQAFRFDAILGLHNAHQDKSLTDDAALCELAGVSVHVIEGDRGNFKITRAEDLPLMEQNLAARCGDIRAGKGYDVHRLVVPQHDLHRLKLAGVEIAHDKVLEGHSDADVALHAITDALLGAVCDGDIGLHFSPKDARWKNADSARFLRHAADIVAARGGIVTHVDLTIVCEAPKISPLREKMRARIAEILALPPSRVSVKATTTEGLGFTGRGEGIAAEAIATVRLPFARPAAADDAAALRWGT